MRTIPYENTPRGAMTPCKKPQLQLLKQIPSELRFEHIYDICIHIITYHNPIMYILYLMAMAILHIT